MKWNEMKGNGMNNNPKRQLAVTSHYVTSRHVKSSFIASRHIMSCRVMSSVVMPQSTPRRLLSSCHSKAPFSFLCSLVCDEMLFLLLSYYCKLLINNTINYS